MPKFEITTYCQTKIATGTAAKKAKRLLLIERDEALDIFASAFMAAL
jgi:hypothetical protein